MLQHPKYRPDIDGLRAIAVLAVVAFHAFPYWLKGGFIGVDVFFVISGYLISTIIYENMDRGTFSFTTFYVRRINRIFPALMIVLVASYAFGWVTLMSDEYKQLGKHIAAGTGFISNIVLWAESGYFDKSAEMKPLLHLWSLGVEEQFYIVWPVLLWIACKRKFNLLTITVLVAGVSFYLNIQGIKNDASATFYSPQTRFWELLCGSLLAWVTLYKKSAFATVRTKIDCWLASALYANKQETDGKTLANVLSFVGLSLLAYGFLMINKELSFPGKWAMIPVFGAILIILGGSKSWVNRIVLSNRIVVWFGLISYPLYLWHWPLLSFARIVENEVPSRNIRIAAVLLSFILAWLTYVLVERPVRLGKKSRVKAIVFVVTMAIVGSVGYITYTRDGLKFRYINEINKGVSQANNYDQNKGYRFDECFLNGNSNKFSDHCSSSGYKNKPLVMIWGDSHAASLYRGFLANGEKFDYDLAQFTSSGCPPVLDFFIANRPGCDHINKFVYGEIKRLKPDTLVLAGYWSMYNGDPIGRWESLDTKKLSKTIQRVKELGIRNIILVGHLPIYTGRQSDMLKRRHLWDKVETRTYRKFNRSAILYDDKIRDVAKLSGINFVSPLAILCDSLGCLIAENSDDIKPFSFDYGHLTEIGSEFLVSKFFEGHFINIIH